MNQFSNKPNLGRGLKIMAICLVILLFAGCIPDVEENISISEITISDIPAKIPVNKKPGEPPAKTFMVYVNASDSQEENYNLERAFGRMMLTDDMLQDDGTYTVTLQLFKPDRSDDSVPYFINGIVPFYGTAKYFSIMISPKDVSVYKQDSIWLMGSSNPLNIEKSNISWDKSGLLNFRNASPAMDLAFGFSIKIKQLYEGTIVKDPEIFK